MRCSVPATPMRLSARNSRAASASVLSAPGTRPRERSCRGSGRPRPAAARPRSSLRAMRCCSRSMGTGHSERQVGSHAHGAQRSWDWACGRAACGSWVPREGERGLLVPTRPFRGTHRSRNACSSTAPTPASGPTRIPPIVATAAVRGRPQDGLRPRRPELLQAHAAGGAVRRRGRHAALAGGRERAQRLADVQALQRQLRPRAVREARHGRAALVCGHLDQLPAEAHVRWSLARTRACTAPDVRSTRVSGPDTAAALVICCLVSAQATCVCYQHANMGAGCIELCCLAGATPRSA